MQPAVFGNLPVELFLCVLDQLVGTRDGHQPVAYAPSDSITKTLRNLTLVSKNTYLLASQYLYTHCIYLDTCTNYSLFRRTLGFDLGYNPEALQYGQASRHEELFTAANIQPHITSLFMSPQKTDCCRATLMIRLPQVIDLLTTIGFTLKRLVLDLQPVYTPASEVEAIRPHFGRNNIFWSMPNLEELICSYDTYDYFPCPPPNLKRLATTSQGLDDVWMGSYPSSLETLFVLRELELDRLDIDAIFNHYKGKSLDVVLIDVSANHQTPTGTREWRDDDIVRIWEIDVPKSYYGDEDDLILCDLWVWEHAVAGTLFAQEKRRMRSWNQLQAALVQVEPA
ncbi:hypothetical protein P154DRAFT_525722 [Amniculicola lignicola CBS 123094]|uniref:Uncharacterized protein n=1 Tax=Amniculicola lignicola CBS 123094 TaxID=1392246 RepID=A0A6A5W4V4_9PLEO|nr:hypothetical protein P154DRAFT_525722 [Amniculicola lignicola CBS 123094]